MLRDSLLVLVFLSLALGGCASTTSARLIPSPQDPVCRRSATALILWATQWRADQKDVPAREVAADEGLVQFFEESGCFESVSLRRLPENSREGVPSAVAEATKRGETVVLIVVRELGPIVRIGASLALVEGGTEVVLDISEFEAGEPPPRLFSVEWRSGGPGVVKGVATLPKDMQAALAVALQPNAR